MLPTRLMYPAQSVELPIHKEAFIPVNTRAAAQAVDQCNNVDPAAAAVKRARLEHVLANGVVPEVLMPDTKAALNTELQCYNLLGRDRRRYDQATRRTLPTQADPDPKRVVDWTGDGFEVALDPRLEDVGAGRFRFNSRQEGAE